MDDIRSFFLECLAELHENSRPAILSLTAIAVESAHAAPAIVDALVAHALSAPPHLKLLAVYVIDSVLKSSAASAFAAPFAPHALSVFSVAFMAAPDEQTRGALLRVLSSWRYPLPNESLDFPNASGPRPLLPSQVLDSMDAFVRSIPRPRDLYLQECILRELNGLLAQRNADLISVPLNNVLHQQIAAMESLKHFVSTNQLSVDHLEIIYNRLTNSNLKLVSSSNSITSSPVGSFFEQLETACLPREISFSQSIDVDKNVYGHSCSEKISNKHLLDNFEKKGPAALSSPIHSTAAVRSLLVDSETLFLANSLLVPPTNNGPALSISSNAPSAITNRPVSLPKKPNNAAEKFSKNVTCGNIHESKRTNSDSFDSFKSSSQLGVIECDSQVSLGSTLNPTKEKKHVPAVSETAASGLLKIFDQTFNSRFQPTNEIPSHISTASSLRTKLMDDSQMGKPKSSFEYNGSGVQYAGRAKNQNCLLHDQPAISVPLPDASEILAALSVASKTQEQSLTGPITIPKKPLVKTLAAKNAVLSSEIEAVKSSVNGAVLIAKEPSSANSEETNINQFAPVLDDVSTITNAVTISCDKNRDSVVINAASSGRICDKKPSLALSLENIYSYSVNNGVISTVVDLDHVAKGIDSGSDNNTCIKNQRPLYFTRKLQCAVAANENQKNFDLTPTFLSSFFFQPKDVQSKYSYASNSKSIFSSSPDGTKMQGLKSKLDECSLNGINNTLNPNNNNLNDADTEGGKANEIKEKSLARVSSSAAALIEKETLYNQPIYNSRLARLVCGSAISESAIKMLYPPRSKQCVQCGRRFHVPCDLEKLDDHMDWHFRTNRKAREVGLHIQSRLWLPRKKPWEQNKVVECLSTPSFFDSAYSKSRPSTNTSISHIFKKSSEQNGPALAALPRRSAGSGGTASGVRGSAGARKSVAANGAAETNHETKGTGEDSDIDSAAGSAAAAGGSASRQNTQTTASGAVSTFGVGGGDLDQTRIGGYLQLAQQRPGHHYTAATPRITTNAGPFALPPGASVTSATAAKCIVPKTVDIDIAGLRCAVCRDPFDILYDEAADNWIVSEGVALSKTRFCHKVCHQDAIREDSELMTTRALRAKARAAAAAAEVAAAAVGDGGGCTGGGTGGFGRGREKAGDIPASKRARTNS